MSDNAVVVFTFKSHERILEEGGTSSWRLDRSHARRCTYAVCTRNAHSDRTEGPEAHHTAFLIGKVRDVVPAKVEGRFLIQFSEFALIDLPDAWHGGRNPVSYASLTELGIDPEKLDWRPMPKEGSELAEAAKPLGSPTTVEAPIGPLTFAQAKMGLALALKVKPESIEITVRG